jgi:hypothetical protein
MKVSNRLTLIFLLYTTLGFAQGQIKPAAQSAGAVENTSLQSTGLVAPQTQLRIDKSFQRQDEMKLQLLSVPSSSEKRETQTNKTFVKGVPYKTVAPRGPSSALTTIPADNSQRPLKKYEPNAAVNAGNK